MLKLMQFCPRVKRVHVLPNEPGARLLPVHTESALFSADSLYSNPAGSIFLLTMRP